MKKLFSLLIGLGLVATLAAPASAGSKETANHPVKGHSTRRTTAITYHGGPIIRNTTNVYVIWYGTWPAGSTTPQILTDLLSSIGGTPYFNINTTYYDGSGVHVSNSVHYAGSVTQSAPDGTSVDVQGIVAGQLGTGALPTDPNGVYFVIHSAGIKESGFGTSFCGYHTDATINGSVIKFASIGDPTNVMNACSAQTVSPNGNAPADAMASVTSHELEEAVTDPQLNAWYDRNGQENADKCAWTFGSTSIASNGSQYNQTFGSRQYLIQQNWVNQGQGFCAKSF